MEAANTPVKPNDEDSMRLRTRGKSFCYPALQQRSPRRKSFLESPKAESARSSPKLRPKVAREEVGELRLPDVLHDTIRVKNAQPRQLSAFNKLLSEPEQDQDSDSVLRLENFSKVGKVAAEVDQIWAFLVLFCIVYNYLLFFFYLGIAGTPSGLALVLELFAELILILDSCALTYLYNSEYQLLRSLPMTHLTSWCRNEKLALVIIWISSYPQHTVNMIAQISPETLSTYPFAILRALKLLRYPEVWGYFASMLKVVRGLHATYVKILQYVLGICMLIHAVVMICLTVVRLETDPRWLTKYGFDQSSSLQIYTQFLLLVTSNMGGMCYGDSQPVTVYEIIIYCIMVYVGSTSFAALFGNIANSIYINNRRTIENRRKLQQVKNFANIKGLSPNLRHRLRAYYSNMHPEFSKYRIPSLALPSDRGTLRTSQPAASEHSNRADVPREPQLHPEGSSLPALRCLLRDCTSPQHPAHDLHGGRPHSAQGRACGEHVLHQTWASQGRLC